MSPELPGPSTQNFAPGVKDSADSAPGREVEEPVS